MRFVESLTKTVPMGMLHALLQKRIQNYPEFKETLSSISAETIQNLQERYLLYSFHLNARRIPQYQQFLLSEKVKVSDIQTVQDFIDKVPETNKKNYIFKAKSMDLMCVDGDYHNISMIVKSSGHSGRQCYWVRSHTEDLYGKTALSVSLDENFQTHEKKTLIINGFILGSWVTGINFNELASWHCPIINIGPDKDEIFQTIKDIGSTFEQIIITGYPPFIKNLVDEAIVQQFSWKKYNIHFIGGGEDFPESWRAYVEKISGGKVRSGFGASDIGILGGMENDDTVFIRKAADQNHALRKDLFGNVEETPMLFQYSLNLHIYANQNKELVFTVILPEAAQPVIKYNLGDEGGTLSQQQIKEILAKHGIKISLHLPLPFFYVLGRKGGAVNFNAFLVYPENIEECIYRNTVIEKTCTGSFQFQSKFDAKHNRKLVVEFQLKKGVTPTSALLKQYTLRIMKTLQDVNEGYKATCQKMPQLAEPLVKLYSFEKYPYQRKIKNKYS